MHPRNFGLFRAHLSHFWPFPRPFLTFLGLRVVWGQQDSRAGSKPTAASWKPCMSDTHIASAMGMRVISGGLKLGYQKQKSVRRYKARRDYRSVGQAQITNKCSGKNGSLKHYFSYFSGSKGGAFKFYCIFVHGAPPPMQPCKNCTRYLVLFGVIGLWSLWTLKFSHQVLHLLVI